MVTGASPLTTAGWRFTFVGVQHGRTYFAQARAGDTSNNRTTTGFASRTFTVT